MPPAWGPAGGAALQLEGCPVGRHDLQLHLGSRVCCVFSCARHEPAPGPCAQARVCYLTWVSIPTMWPSIKPYVLTFQYLEIQSSGVPSLISWDQGQDLNVFIAA